MLLTSLIEKARKKGYTVAKIPASIFGFTLPEWVSCELDFISPKGMHYTKEGVARKFLEKQLRRAERRRKSLFREFLKNDLHPENPYTF